MDEQQEQIYLRGQRSAYNNLLRFAQHELGYDTPEATAVSWQIEREEAIAALRSLCAEFGDNEWDESLHLADIIDKHLDRHLNF